MAYPSQKSITSRPNLMPKGDEEGLVDAWDLGKVVNNTVYGLKGNNGTVYGGPSVIKTPIGNLMQFDGADDYIDCASVPVLNTGNFTLEAWVYFNNVAVSSGIISDGTAALSSYYAIRYDFGAGINFFSYNGANRDLYGPILRTGTIYHVCAVWVRNVSKTLYINGAQVNTTNANVDIVGDLAGVRLGRFTSATPMLMNGGLASPCIYNRALSDQEVRNNYLKGKTALWRTEYGPAVSSADEGGTVGQYISNTPFQCGDTTVRARVETDIINGVSCKVITCKAIGLLYCPASIFQQTPTEAAFGTWKFWTNKVNTGAIHIMFVDEIRYLGGSQNGYFLDFNTIERWALYRVSAGVQAPLFYTNTSYIPNSTWVENMLTRTNAGIFTGYMNNEKVDVTGGTGTNPATDTNHTVAPYLVIDFASDVGSKIAIADVSGGHAISKRAISI